MVDLTVNILCAGGGIFLATYLGKKIRISDNFWASIGFTIVWAETYLAARVFHISFILLPFNGGITWQKPARLLALSFLGAIAAVFFFIKDRKNLAGNVREK